MFVLSRFCKVFSRGDVFLLYNSKRNNFYELSREAYEFIQSIQNEGSISDSHSEDEKEFIELLKEKEILVNPLADDAYVDDIVIARNTMSYSRTNISLTIAPTLMCNLRCPYCFEQNKPIGIMDDNTADGVVEFIRNQDAAKTLNVTWFGGEPLICTDRIDYLLERFNRLEDISLINHSIVTNGTLIDDKVISLFREYPLNDMQITLDGNECHHNKKRFHADGSGSFDEIMCNIERISTELPEVKLSIRINVDNSNFRDYSEVADLLDSKFEGKNVSYYPGILIANKGCESETFFSSRDYVEFMRLLRQSGKSISYPTHHANKGCCATGIASHVIGPRGELYRCWEHVGVPQNEIGSIFDNKITNPKLFRAFMLHGTGVDDNNCRNCLLFPICSCGCPNKRVDNLLNGSKNDLCSVYKNNDEGALEDMLYEYYLQTVK